MEKDNTFMRCPVCDSPMTRGFVQKGNDEWNECDKCESVFTGKEAPQLIGGTLEGAEQTRSVANNQRWLRLQKYVQQYHSGRYLDYGCGNGLLVQHINNIKGCICYGYDKYNSEFSNPFAGEYDGIFLVETIEHLTNPLEVLKDIRSLLKPNGYLYLESSFRWNQTLDELLAWDYMDSALGHSTIISEKGLPILFERAGFTLVEKMNRNTFIWRKV